MATILTENLFRDGHYVVSQANGYRSREQGILASGSNKPRAGTVVGKVTASGKYAPLNVGASDGTQTAAAILWNAGVDATSADARATFSVRDEEINAAVLAWPVGITDNQRNTALGQLRGLGIIQR